MNDYYQLDFATLTGGTKRIRVPSTFKGVTGMMLQNATAKIIASFIFDTPENGALLSLKNAAYVSVSHEVLI